MKKQTTHTETHPVKDVSAGIETVEQAAAKYGSEYYRKDKPANTYTFHEGFKQGAQWYQSNRQQHQGLDLMQLSAELSKLNTELKNEDLVKILQLVNKAIAKGNSQQQVDNWISVEDRLPEDDLSIYYQLAHHIDVYLDFCKFIPKGHDGNSMAYFRSVVNNEVYDMTEVSHYKVFSIEAPTT